MTTTAPPPTLEILTRADAGACVALAKSCGWADESSDWRPLFAASEVLGVRADDGSLIATCVRTSYGAVTTLGKMLVHASARGRGLARALVERTVASANGSIVSLVATACRSTNGSAFRPSERSSCCGDGCRATTRRCRAA